MKYSYKALFTRSVAASGVLAAIVCTRPLPVGADGPPGRYTFPTTGVVYDTRTQLTWQRELDTTQRNQADAIRYCTALKLGDGTWRVPTRAELLTIVDPTRFQPAIDTTAFSNTPKDAACWTSSHYVFNPNYTWSIGFESGGAGATESTMPIYVRCVR